MVKNTIMTVVKDSEGTYICMKVWHTSIYNTGMYIHKIASYILWPESEFAESFFAKSLLQRIHPPPDKHPHYAVARTDKNVLLL